LKQILEINNKFCFGGAARKKEMMKNETTIHLPFYRCSLFVGGIK
jgi:hypothetical protein